MTSRPSKSHKTVAKRKLPAKAPAPRGKRKAAVKRKPAAKAAATRAKRKPVAKRKATAKAASPRAKRKVAQTAGNLKVEQLADMLRVPAETIRNHVADGAPAEVSRSGTRINLVHYAAWLIQRLQKVSGKDDA